MAGKVEDKKRSLKQLEYHSSRLDHLSTEAICTTATNVPDMS